MIRHTLIGAALALCLYLGLSCSRAEARVIERVAAVVNDHIVLLSDLNERLAPMLSQLSQVSNPELRKQRLEQMRTQMLDLMISEELIRQEAQKLKLSVSDADLERAIKSVMEKNNLSRDELEQALQREGKTIATYKETILRPQILRMRVLNIQVGSRVTISDDEVRAYYQASLRDLGADAKVKARHIFIELPSGARPAEVNERRRLAEKVALLARQSGTNEAAFGKLAKQYSEDPATRDDGGDLGFFGRGSLPPTVEKVVFTMKPGQVHGPIRAERGFHIILMVERRESSARPLAEVKDELVEQLYAKRMEKATKVWTTELRRKSHVEIKLGVEP